MEWIVHISFCIAYFFVPFMALFLIPYAGISLKMFTIPSLFIIYYLAFAYFGILPIYFGWDMDSLPLGIVDRSIILKMFIYSSTALICIIFGFIFARRAVGFHIEYHHALISRSTTMQRVMVLFFVLLSFLVLVSYICQIENIALFTVLNKDVNAAYIERSKMGNAFAGKYWHYQIFFRTLLDYCVTFFFADYLIGRHRSSAIFFIGTFLIAVFSATMAIEKAPIANLMIMLYLAYVIYKGGSYWQSASKYCVLILTFILSLAYMFFMGSDFTSTFQFIPGRILLGQISDAYFYLDLFPARLDYLLGASFPNPAGILPFENYPLTLEVWKHMYPEGVKGVVGSAPAVFWAEMYANFGPLGVIYSSFLVGIGLFMVSHILSKFSFSPAIIAATASLAIHYTMLTLTSLSGYLVDTTLVAIAVITISTYFLGRNTSLRIPR